MAWHALQAVVATQLSAGRGDETRSILLFGIWCPLYHLLSNQLGVRLQFYFISVAGFMFCMFVASFRSGGLRHC